MAGFRVGLQVGGGGLGAGSILKSTDKPMASGQDEGSPGCLGWMLRL